MSLATAPGLEDSAEPAVTGGTIVYSLPDAERVAPEPLAKIIAEILRRPDGEDDDLAAPFQSSI
ncbi:hypothetical protein [Phytohabitans houttuyneae]|uniref:hypothetical protein n=1 Tax=Phytohabitans houttuyneae TaxID=1076126 RepID=UPI00156474B9|nr:hypothetical protein [Phytohabitans houttuyneae]